MGTSCWSRVVVVLQKTKEVQQLCQDIEHLKINILAVQKTKIKGEEKTDRIQPENGVWTENTWNTILGSESTKGYSKCNNSFHGVGFITKSNVNCKFASFANRLALLTVYIEYNNGRTHPLNIINAYAPTSNSSIAEIELLLR